MTATPPRAFLALWNGIASAAVQAEYESWHSFEHVPERVGLPGFVEAARYRSLDTPLRYFTCYGLASIEVLSTPEYHDVFTHPTPWSTRMRTVLRDFYRLPCEHGGRHGHTTGSRLATLRWRSTEPGLVGQVDAWLQQRIAAGDLLQAQWGWAPPTDAYWLPNAEGRLRGEGPVQVALLQHLDAALLRAVVQALAGFLQPRASDVSAAETFELLTHVRQDELDSPPGVRRPPHDTLFHHFNGK